MSFSIPRHQTKNWASSRFWDANCLNQCMRFCRQTVYYGFRWELFLQYTKYIFKHGYCKSGFFHGLHLVRKKITLSFMVTFYGTEYLLLTELKKELWERLQNTCLSHLHGLVCFEERGNNSYSYSMRCKWLGQVFCNLA